MCKINFIFLLFNRHRFIKHGSRCFLVLNLQFIKLQFHHNIYEKKSWRNSFELMWFLKTFEGWINRFMTKRLIDLLRLLIMKVIKLNNYRLNISLLLIKGFRLVRRKQHNNYQQFCQFSLQKIDFVLNKN